MRVLILGQGLTGHMRPLMPLAAQLAGAGHEVRLATGPGGEAVVRGADDPLPVWLVGPPVRDAIQATRARGRMAPAATGQAGGAGASGWRIAVTAFDQILAPSMLEALVARCRDWTPELIVFDQSSHAAPILAARLGVPAVSVAIGVLYPEEVLAFSDDLLEPLWRSNGLEPQPWGGEFEHVRLDMCPPAMRPAHAQRFSTTRPLRSPDAGPLDRAAGTPGRRPLLYVTLGTIYARADLFETILEGTRDVDCDVIVTTGNRDPLDVRGRRDGVIVERYRAQHEVLKVATAVICHGGAGSLFGALAHGRPVACLPLGADQFWNAEAAQKAGFGLVINAETLTPETVRNAVDHLLDDPQLLDGAQLAAGEIQRMPVPAHYLETLSSLASGR